METLQINVVYGHFGLFSTLKEALKGQPADDSFDFSLPVLCSHGEVELTFSWVRLGEYFDAYISIYDVSDRSSFERAIRYIEYIRDYSKPVLLLGMRYPGSTVQVATEEGASAAKQHRCMFAQTDSDNREQALACIIRFVEEIIEKKPSMLRRMLQAEQQLKAEALACGIKPELFKSLKSAKTNIEDILEFGVEENYHVRVMVVGKEGVGKSTLTRRLVQLPVDIKQYKSTDGIEVHVRRCEVDLDSGTWTTLNEKSLLEKFKWIFKLGETTDKATGDDRDFHQRVAKALQTADQSSVFGSKRVPASNSSELTRLHMKTESATTIKQHKDVPKTTPRELRSSRRAFTAEDMETSLQKAKIIQSKGKRRKANIDFYDFAGQDIFHASHPTFMSSKAIFILVFKLLTMYEELISKSQDGTVEQQLEIIFNNPESNIGSMLFWLYTIYMHSSRDTELFPHVLLVGTHADKIPWEDRDTIIKQCFDVFRKYIVGLPFNSMLAKTEFAVDNTKTNNPVFNAIKETIFELGKTLPNWGKETPTKWLPLDREIQSLKVSGQKVLSVEQLRDINRGLELRLSGEEEMTMFLQFLHDSGEIIYFCQEGLKNIIVLDPVWMIDALKTIITAEAFAIRKPGLDVLWKDFRNSGIISKSAIVNIFKENDNDKSLYDNHEHVIRLMEKFLYIASPLKFSEETTDATTHGAVWGVVLDQRDVNFIMPCMVNKRADSDLLTNDAGKSSTTVFCMMTDTKFLPPIVFHKLLAICIAQWPIVEQSGQKMIFSETCRFNIDRQGSYKLTIFFLKHGIRFRIISFVDYTQPDITICQPTMEFLTSNFKSVLQAMGFSDDIKTYIQCPQFLPTQSGGLLETDLMENQKHITCDECQKSHCLETSKILGCWIDTDNFGKVLYSRQNATAPIGTPGQKITDKNIGMPDSSRSYFKKPDDDTLSEAKISQYEKAMKSVGILFAFENQIGTVFRVGSKYVMTAFHCYLKIIDPVKNGAIKLDNLKHPSVLVTFEYPQYNNPNPIVFQIQNATYTNKQFDIAILELNDPAARLPPPLKLYEHELSVMMLRYVDIIGYGHPNSDKKQLDPACKTLLPQGSEIQFAKEWVRDNKAKLKHYVKPGIDSSCVERGYEGYDRKENILFSCWLEHGASGAPILTTKCSDSPVVVGVVTKGLPFWYWDLTSDGQFSFRNEYRFEVGTKMVHIARDIASSNYVLGCDLFK